MAGMDFLASKDASASATLDFTELVAATYDAYLFVLQNLVPANDAVNFYFRVSSDGGVNYDAGALDYTQNRAGRDSSQANDVWVTRGGSAAEVSVTISQNVGSAAGEDGLSGHFMLFGPHLNKQTHVEFSVSYINAGGLLESNLGSAVRGAASVVDAVRFLFSAGNIESGTITMYGLSNA